MYREFETLLTEWNRGRPHFLLLQRLIRSETKGSPRSHILFPSVFVRTDKKLRPDALGIFQWGCVVTRSVPIQPIELQIKELLKKTYVHLTLLKCLSKWAFKFVKYSACGPTFPLHIPSSISWTRRWRPLHRETVSSGWLPSQSSLHGCDTPWQRQEERVSETHIHRSHICALGVKVEGMACTCAGQVAQGAAYQIAPPAAWTAAVPLWSDPVQPSAGCFHEAALNNVYLVMGSRVNLIYSITSIKHHTTTNKILLKNVIHCHSWHQFISKQSLQTRIMFKTDTEVYTLIKKGSLDGQKRLD